MQVGRYSIKQIEQLTGIKAHTLRIWEQRYQVLAPHRTDTNIRFYDDEQLKKILNIATLVKAGVKISKAICYSEEDQKKFLEDLTCDEFHLKYVQPINEILTTAIDLDEENFEKIFSSSVLKWGFTDTFENILLPVMQKIGIMWGIDDIQPYQEHFISYLIRQKIITSIDGLPKPTSKETYLLFQREGEMHEISLLYMNYLLRLEGKKTIYIGCNVPKDDIQTIIEKKKPDYICSVCITSHQLNWKEFIHFMKELSTNHQIILSGSKIFHNKLQQIDDLIWCDSICDFKTQMQNN